MNSPIEDRLREALQGVGELLPPAALPPAPSARPRRHPWRIGAAVLATAAAVIGGMFAGRAVLGPDDRHVNAAPSAKVFPGPYHVDVIFCTKISANPDCHHKEATLDQINTTLAMALKLPGVENADFETTEEAVEKFREIFKGNKLAATVKVGDIPSTLQLTLVDPRYADAVANAFEGGYGIDQVVNERALLNPPTTMPTSGTPIPMSRP